MRRRFVILVVLAGSLLLAAAPGATASCVNPDPRVTLARGDAAFVGALAERTGDDLRFTVERPLRGSLAREVVVRDENPRSTIGLAPRPGERIGLVVHDRGGVLVASECDRADAAELIRAAASAPPCEVGGEVRRRRIGEEESAGIRRQTPALILGCVRAAPGRELELTAYRQSAAVGSLLCIDFADLLRRSASGCGTNRRRGRAPAWVQGSVRDGGRLELHGPATASVREVRLHYTLDGRRRTRPVAFVRVTIPALLRRLRIAEPFGQFVAAVPRGARGIRLTAHGAGGRRLGRVHVPPSFRLP